MILKLQVFHSGAFFVCNILITNGKVFRVLERLLFVNMLFISVLGVPGCLGAFRGVPVLLRCCYGAVPVCLGSV